MNRTKIRLIYIIGKPRSGSTLLDRLLGEHPDLFSAGEVKPIWEASFIKNQLCGCGKPFKECEVWQQIVGNFLNENRDFDAQEMINLHRTIDRLRYIPKLIVIKKLGLLNRNIQQMNNIFYSLYKAIHSVITPKYIIDSTKEVPFAFILNMNPNLDVYLLHIVRDSRAVAYSWQRRKIRPEIINRVEYMQTYSPFRTSMCWLLVNILSGCIGRGMDNYKRIRYEDLIKRPKSVLSDIFSFLTIDNKVDKIMIEDDTAYLGTNHTVAGNPVRFRTGKMKLKLDEEWKTKMKNSDKFLVSLLTFPVLKYFNYSVR